MLAYFWMLWQFDQYDPSTHAKYTSRVDFDRGTKQESREREKDASAASARSGARLDKKDGRPAAAAARSRRKYPSPPVHKTSTQTGH